MSDNNFIGATEYDYGPFTLTAPQDQPDDKNDSFTKYTDTYSKTPYATYMLTPLSGKNIEDVLYRDHNDIIYCEDEMSATKCNSNEEFINKRQSRPSGCTKRHCCRKKTTPTPTPTTTTPPPTAPPPTTTAATTTPTAISATFSKFCFKPKFPTANTAK